jgi:hypothetical protein
MKPRRQHQSSGCALQRHDRSCSGARQGTPQLASQQALPCAQRAQAGTHPETSQAQLPSQKLHHTTSCLPAAEGRTHPGSMGFQAQGAGAWRRATSALVAQPFLPSGLGRAAAQLACATPQGFPAALHTLPLKHACNPTCGLTPTSCGPTPRRAPRQPPLPGQCQGQSLSGPGPAACHQQEAHSPARPGA